MRLGLTLVYQSLALILSSLTWSHDEFVAQYDYSTQQKN